MAGVAGRSGLKPGQRHSGQFKRGFDPRRAVAPLHPYKGHSVLTLARQHTEDCVAVLAECMTDKRAAWAARTSAATALLDRAWGRPANTLDVSVQQRPTELPALTSDDLKLIAAGIQVDGECEVVPAESEGENSA